MSLDVLIDVPHRRAFLERMVLLCGHDEWSVRFRQSTWTDPITKTTILTPTPYQDSWRTQHTGDFRRLRRADFFVGSDSGDNGNAAKWYDQNRGMNAGDWFIANQDTHDRLYSKDVWPVNTGFYIEFVSVSAGAEKFKQFDFTWGEGPAAINLAVYSDGSAEVSKGGLVVFSGSIKGSSDTPSGTAGSMVGLMILPWRFRELLVVSSAGAGFAHAFADLDDDTAGQAILPAGRISFEWPSGSVQMQVAPVRYATTGYVCSPLGIFRSVPETGRAVETFAYCVGAGATARLVEETAIGTNFVANGVRRNARVRVDLSGASTASPFLLGARAGIAPVAGFTSDEAQSILCDLTRLSLDVPEDAAGLSLSLQFKPSTSPATTQFRLNASNRPLAVEIDGLGVLEAVTEPPHYQLRNVLGGELIHFEARDYSKSLENYLFPDEIPLDGMTLADAFRLVASSAGENPAAMVLESDLETFRLPLPDGSGKWAVLIQVGDSAQDWMNRLHSDYCGSYLLANKPTMAGYVPHVTRLSRGDESLCTVYQTLSAASLGGYSEPEKGVYRSYKEHKLECEANVIHVTGQDPSSGRPIFVTMEDSRSIDPAIPVASRPDNWLGERRVYGFGDPSITSLGLAERVCEELYRRLTWCRFMAEIECEMLFSTKNGLPIWRGDCITLDQIGVFRVEAFSVDFTVESAGMVRRKANYTLEYMRPTD